MRSTNSKAERTDQRIEATVCVIGAGPGGSATAIALAKKGIDCVLVDKAAFPRDKVCGEVMDTSMIRALDRLDPTIVPRFEGEPFSSSVEGTTVFAPNGKRMKLKFRAPADFGERPSCYVARRYHLDQFLFEEAKSYAEVTALEGVELFRYRETAEGAELDSKCGLTIRCRLVVAANGTNSFFTRKVAKNGLDPRHHAAGVRAYFKGVKIEDERYSELFFMRELLPGGMYMCRMPGGLTNVNLGMRSDMVSKKRVNLKRLMEKTLGEHPAFREKFEGAERVGPIMGFSSPLNTTKRPISGNRYLLVGDAAGLIDALSGNGIGPALISGTMAAEQAAEAVAANDFSAAALKPYDGRVHAKMDKLFKMGKMLAPLADYPMLTGAFIWFVNAVVSKSHNNDMVASLFYDSNVGKTLRKPSFYYKLLAG